MKWRGGVVGVEITAHAHATEDVSKVKKAIENLLPQALHGRVEVEEQLLEGHHGNPIVRIRVRIRGVDALELLKHLFSKMSDADRRVLRGLLGSRYDERGGRLFLRFSKQDAYLGEVRLCDGDDVVHVVVVFRGSPSIEEVVRTLEELGLKA